MKLYFPHIEGLRFVAAMLVAVYHVWTERISGGVDVFFVVSGLLITLSLLRQLDQDKKISPTLFLSDLGLRLFPAAMVTLALVAFGTFLFLPVSQHSNTLREILASLLYYENWQLAAQSVDYLDRENPPSAVQHFWAMSIQGQFYIYAIVIFLAAAAFKTIQSRRATLSGFILITILLSFAYSVYQTYFGNQAWAYFDMFARVWEFALGGGLAMLLVRSPTLRLPALFGWLGLGAFLLCGLIFNVATAFPGAAALFPVTAAMLVILGGRDGDTASRWSVQRLLGSRVMTSLGSVSYGLYLLHWPILVFFQHVSGKRPNLVEGGLIILLSIALAYAINYCIEKPIIRLKSVPSQWRGHVSATASAMLLLPPLAAIGATYFNLTRSEAQLVASLTDKPTTYAARPLTDADAAADYQLLTPSPEIVRLDKPVSYHDGCHLNQTPNLPVWCVYGSLENYERTVVMVGGSHTAHWLPALQEIAKQRNWRIIYSTWSSCQFNIGHTVKRCADLSEATIEKIAEIRPDFIFMTANSGRDSSPHSGTIATWNKLNDRGFRVVAFRGTPRYETMIPDCLASMPDDLRSCGRPRSDLLAPNMDFSKVPPNVHIFDLSDFLCTADFCPATIRNVVVYIDQHHLSTTFVRTLVPVIEERLVSALRNVPIAPQTEVAAVTLTEALLACGPLGRNAPITRTVFLNMDGDSMEYKRGNWESREGMFEIWKGEIRNDTMEVSGEYREGGGDVRSVSFVGTVREGSLLLGGKRGPRLCSISSTSGGDGKMQTLR